MTDLIIRSHALEQYYIRSAVDPISAKSLLENDLKTATRMTIPEAKELGFTFTTHTSKDCCVYVWYNPHIREEMCALVKDNVVITVMTKRMFSWSGHPKKMSHDINYKRGQVYGKL